MRANPFMTETVENKELKKELKMQIKTEKEESVRKRLAGLAADLEDPDPELHGRTEPVDDQHR